MARAFSFILWFAAAAWAEDAAQRFAERIQPVLRRDCTGCHGDGQTMAKLDLRTREGMLRGGQRGPAVVPGKAAQSLMLRALEADGLPQMPPVGAKPDAAFRAEVARWIDAGAPWPEAAVSKDWGQYKPEDLWAFRPLAKDAGTPIDGSLDARMKAKGLTAAPRADRLTLIRRVTIDLTGLPPSPEEIDAFLADRSAEAWGKVVDRLLASPRYGERWARHWLDVVRYADTSGYSNDFERPNAWRYRDYVIRAFQQDKPYDRFLKEQVAGDELYPGDGEALIATGFLRAGPWEHTGMSVEAVTRQMFLDDVTHGVGTVFLGMTLGCARCHDHKFDPLPTKDYYRMQAVFATTEFARPAVPFLAGENTGDLSEGKRAIGSLVERTQREMDRFGELALESAMKKHGVSRVEDLPAGVAEKVRRSKDGISADQFEEYKLYQKHGALYKESADRYEAKAFAVSSGPRDGATDGGPQLRYPKRADYRPPVVHVLPGGNVQSPAEAVTPGALSALARYGGYAEPRIPETVEGRRAALAEWMADVRHPLTARVMVNRIWQYHFGKGIVADANNFGKMGRKPSHPELLDALAARFIASGWSVKTMHREILRSEAYQRSSRVPAGAAEKDPNNDLLAAYPARRVEAEVLRDAILAVAGELSADAGGPGTFPQINEDVARQPQHRMGSLAPVYQASLQKRQRNRRTIYTFQQRTQADPMVEVFNGPAMDLSCERRETSVLPTQAFALFNGEFVNDMALAFAARVSREAGTPAARVDRAFRLAFGRLPTGEEKRLALGHYERMLEHHRAHRAAPRPKPAPVVHQITSELTGESFAFEQKIAMDGYEQNLHASEVSTEVRAMADVTLGLLNANEFVYVY